VIVAGKASLLLIVSLLLLTACGVPRGPDAYEAPGRQSIATAQGVPVKPVAWSGAFSCTAHIDGQLPAITWNGIPFRQEGDRLTGLHTFIDSFDHRNSVVFSGTLAGQHAQVSVTSVRSNGSPNFTAEMTGSPASMAGQMMSGMSQRPVRLCTLALIPAA
jgi:hypothetical protein